jgi:glycosyltransferase involved in cell wall biosynthesis
LSKWFLQARANGADSLTVLSPVDHETRESRYAWSPDDGPSSSVEIPHVCVIVPTRNEGINVRPLVARLVAAQHGVPTEVIFVDDSDDDTPKIIDELIEDLAQTITIRMLHRPDGTRRGGLGGAVVEGMRVARAPWVCVMDADLQHPPELVASLLATAKAKKVNLVVASRYCVNGSAAGLSPRSRVLASRGAAATARMLFPRRLRGMTDPMSGFFIVEKKAVDPEVLKPSGFKILLELAVRTDGLRVAEVGYSFGDRHGGKSKAGARVGMSYVAHLGRLRSDTLRPTRSRVATTTHRYDIHGIVRVESEGKLPELEAFRVNSLSGEADISVRIGALPPHANLPQPEVDNPFHVSMRYEEIGNFGFGADIAIRERVSVLATPLLAHSPHVLYTNLVEPILRWEFVRRGYALVHGACIVQGDDAYLITARTDTGKTTTMLKLLDDFPYEFVSDDLTLVSSSGDVRPYPKPLTISSHTLQAVKRHRLTWRERATLPVQSRLHSRRGRRFAFVLSKLRLPAASINALAQLLIPPPKYPVQRLVPGVQIATTAKVNGVFIIHRSDENLEWLDPETTLDIVLANTEDAYGFPPYHTIENFLLTGAPENLREIERQIIAGALENASTAMIPSRSYDWASRIPGLIELIVEMRDASASSGQAVPSAPPVAFPTSTDAISDLSD